MANRRFEMFQYRQILTRNAVGRVGSCDRPFRIDGSAEGRHLSACSAGALRRQALREVAGRVGRLG